MHFLSFCYLLLRAFLPPTLFDAASIDNYYARKSLALQHFFLSYLRWKISDSLLFQNTAGQQQQQVHAQKFFSLCGSEIQIARSLIKSASKQ
jgi:hypothetical protein